MEEALKLAESVEHREKVVIDFKVKMREMTKEHAQKVQELQKIAKLTKDHDPFDIKNINLEIGKSTNSRKEGVTAPSKDPLANPYVGNTRANPSNVVMAP
ncbi:hypothetical protein GOBAR_DD13430 [Gossypium barbadense]|nr:hypothetical protein GOBAR_DD13430 [Gossypium barbadense]